jgi:hypothetical protein
MCLQGGRAHPLAACGVATRCYSPPALLDTETTSFTLRFETEAGGAKRGSAHGCRLACTGDRAPERTRG